MCLNIISNKSSSMRCRESEALHAGMHHFLLKESRQYLSRRCKESPFHITAMHHLVSDEERCVMCDSCGGKFLFLSNLLWRFDVRILLNGRCSFDSLTIHLIRNARLGTKVQRNLFYLVPLFPRFSCFAFYTFVTLNTHRE